MNDKSKKSSIKPTRDHAYDSNSIKRYNPAQESYSEKIRRDSQRPIIRDTLSPPDPDTKPKK